MTPTLFSLDDPADFDRFWLAYPRHDAKKDARRAWTQIRPDADLVTRILTNLQDRRWPAEKKYIPLPASYLRGGRYDDEGGRDGREAPAAPANRWQPSARATRLIYGGMGIACPHEPICETDIDCIRRRDNDAGPGL